MAVPLINGGYSRCTLIITVIFVLFSAYVKVGCSKNNKPTEGVTIVQLDSAGGAHVTTRTNIRRVWKYNETWFVFYSTDEAGERSNKHVYRTSSDGVNWSKRKYCPGFALPYFYGSDGYAHIGKGGPMKSDDKIWYFKHWIVEAKINGEELEWSEKSKIFDDPLYHTNFYYIQPRIDSLGNICMTMRHVDHTQVNKSKQPLQSIIWVQNKIPWSTEKWHKPMEIITGINEMEGADSHASIPLEKGQWMVLGRTAAGHYNENGPKGAFYARYFDGKKWGKQIKLDTSDGTGGSDRRFSAAFDKDGKRLHMVYIDGKKRLVYRVCNTPYTEIDWSKPYYPVKGKFFTQCLGLDFSTQPARPVIVYGLQKKSDGGRLHTGALYMIKRSENVWSKPLLISEKGRNDNWYPNMIEDCSSGIGVLYLRNFYKGRAPKSNKKPWDVMFSKIEISN